MEDAVKVLSAKFNLSSDILKRVGNDSEDISSWLTVLGAYVLDNDKKQEEQKSCENNLRKQRLNAEHQLSQLEKQLISCNSRLAKYEKQLLEVNLKLEKTEEDAQENDKKLQEITNQNKVYAAENETLKQKYSYLENEKLDFAELIETKNKEVDRLNQEWNEMSSKLSEVNKIRYELKYELDEIKNSDVRKEFKEKRLEEEKNMLSRQIEQITSELRVKTDLVNNLQKDTTSRLLEVESKYSTIQQEALQLKNSLETSRKTCTEQASKIENLMMKLKRQVEEHTEAENNIQQELTAQTKLVQLYKDDRDHAKSRLEEVTSAITELQELLRKTSEDNTILDAKVKTLENEKSTTIEELNKKVKELNTELENANDLLQVSRKKGTLVVGEKDISSLSPMAAATSALLKKGMTLTQIYTEYVKVSDELLAEREENGRLKMYMEQILQEVEEKAPLLRKQKEDYEHARNTVENMSVKLEENIKECHKLQNEHAEYERKLNFHKREEKRLKALCIDLSQQVRVLLKEVENARGGAVSSSNELPNLQAGPDDLNNSSSGQIISEHLVTFKNIEELQEQNQRLLATVRQLSEDQERLEQEGGHEVIQDLKKKIENAKTDLDSMMEHQKTQDEIMQQLSRQRDMYKVLYQTGSVMVGDVSSTTATGSQSFIEVETELTKTKAELDNTLSEQAKYKDEVANKQKELNDTVTKLQEEVSSLKLEKERLKNQLEFAEEKQSIVVTTSEGLKKEIKALEAKCKSVTEALNKVRVESENYKQNYSATKEKLVTSEVSVKALVTEKNLVKEAEKRLMQENQSLLDQQRSQNVLLTNLQSIQNNLERQEFETRKTLGKQVEVLQREMKALRRQNENEGVQLKISAASLEKECKELKVKLGVEMEKNKQIVVDLNKAKEDKDSLDSKCRELENLAKASENRLQTLLQSESSTQAKDDFEHEIERYKVKVRELELAVSNAVAEKKASDDQIEVLKKHIEQYKEIGDSNEQAINLLTKAKESQAAEMEKKISDASNSIQNYKKQLAGVLAIKNQIKKAAEDAEKNYLAQIAELKQANAPLERRLQEVTKALVQAKELESSAVKESQIQVNLAKEAQDKYERELVLHAKDVEMLTALKEESGSAQARATALEEQLSEMKQTLTSNEKLIKQMTDHNKEEIKKGELVRKDLIDQNAILHGQVEKLSAQLAAAKSLNRTDDDKEASNDKSLADVYELLRFVRREKEIAETKAEASETESMRYRQRAEHLQRDLEETKAALELELQRTQGKMLTEEEHKDMLEKLKKLKQVQGINGELEKQKSSVEEKNKTLLEKLKKVESDLKTLSDSKKSLEGEKSVWLAEKTALKGEVERWTNRTNQLMAQSAKADNEEIKKLQTVKSQNEKTIIALQEDVKRTKQQLDYVKRESLKLKTEKTENQNKIASLQAELVQANVNRTATTNTSAANSEQNTNLQKELDEAKKSIAEMNDKMKMMQQIKKVAKKYKTQTDKLLTILKEHKIIVDANLNVTSSPPTTGTAENTSTATGQVVEGNNVSSEDKKEFEVKLNEKEKRINTLTDQISELQGQYEAEKISAKDVESKLLEVQKFYADAEKRLLEQSKDSETIKKSNEALLKEIESLRTECAEAKKKLEEQQEKNKKVLLTAKDKIKSLTKIKDNNSREKDQLKKQVEDLKTQLKSRSTAAVEQSKTLLAEKASYQDELNKLQSQVNELSNQINTLNEKNEDLLKKNSKLQEDKRQAEKFIKAASQQKARVQVVSHHTASVKSISQQETTETGAVAPLTATVRPHATPSQPVQKYHPQSTPTASIRPLAHAAPTAMISPSVPATHSTTSSNTAPVASISALPVAAQVQPQVVIDISSRAGPSRSSVSDRSSAFKAPVARVVVQAQERGESSGAIVPNVEEHSSEQTAGTSGESTSQHSSSSSSSNKRTHTEIDEEDELFLEECDVEGDEPGNKRQRVDIVEEQRDSQESGVEVLEDEGLLEEEVSEGHDEEIIASQSVPNQEVSSRLPVTQQQQLLGQQQQQRALQPSPQNIMRQRNRGRSQQLPSFSLPPGQSSGGFYEEDDSTVPSTPTLFMPKRTDGFAEAVSSPHVRPPTFLFSANEPQTSSHVSGLEDTAGMSGTRIEMMGSEDQANVPMTPLGVVPTEAHIMMTKNTQFFPTEDSGDNGQEEQNVPQQIDLTEDDEEDEEIADSAEIDTDVDGNTDAIEIFAPEEIDQEEIDDERDDASDDSDSSDSSSEESVEDELASAGVDDELKEDEVKGEQVEMFQKVTGNEAGEDASVPEEKQSRSDSPDILEEVSNDNQQSSSSTVVQEETTNKAATEQNEAQQENTKTEETEKASRPVRLQRSKRGVRARFRR